MYIAHLSRGGDHMERPLGLETRYYVDANSADVSEILTFFRNARTLQLPVVEQGRVVGLLNVLDLLTFREAGGSNLPIDRNVVVGREGEDICQYQLPDQDILPFEDASGTYVGYIRKSELIEATISRRLAAEMQYYRDLQEEFDAIFRSSNDGIFIADGNGTVIRINKASERIDDVRAEEVLGKNMRDLVAQGFYSESVTLKVIETGAPVTILQKTKTGKEIMATGTPLYKNGELYRVVVNSRDITELNALKNALRDEQYRTERIKCELNYLRKVYTRNDTPVFRSAQMEKVFDLALRVAGVDSTVLIQGESGVGKEVVSKFIHMNSARKDKPFIKIDCSGIPESLLESELFGYEKGAFTGASKTGKLGLIELANEGTLFLDEIGELHLNLQSKLLRVIQDREICRLGGIKTIPVDIRVIAATNRKLEDMIRANLFREDLYYRLNVVPIFVPPLRERRADIQPLLTYFIDRYNKRFGYAKTFDPEAVGILLDYDWPGNVRELENMVERLIVTTTGDVIRVDDLPVAPRRTRDSGFFLKDRGLGLAEIVTQCERDLLLKVMASASSTYEMARILKIDVSTVRRKLKKHKVKISFRK
ncbi:MAG: sigma 54-interacting transcriptional regulator [Bacillota bacterium]